MRRKEGFFYSKKHKRYFKIDSTRLKGWNYASDGVYFITTNVKQKNVHEFGEVHDNKMFLNGNGEIARYCYFDLLNHYQNCVLDAFIVMPDHVHMIIWIVNDVKMRVETQKMVNDVLVLTDKTWVLKKTFNTTMTFGVPSVETGLRPVSTDNVCGTNVNNNKKHGLFEIIRAFKSFSARKINEKRGTTGIPFWQSRFYDRVIRDESALNRTRKYIINNPKNWLNDRNNNNNKTNVT